MSAPTPAERREWAKRLLLEGMTPGPWDAYGNEVVVAHTSSPGEWQRLAQVSYRVPFEQQAAIAALIAAAPDLAAAVRDLADENERLRYDLGKAETALAVTRAAAERRGAERDALREQVERLREALSEIVAYETEHDYTPISNEGCEECRRCREREWPPSRLCDNHFRDLAAREHRNRMTDEAQHLRLRDIARAALTEETQP